MPNASQGASPYFLEQIPKDVWNQLLPFIQEIAIDRKTKALRNYNEEVNRL